MRVYTSSRLIILRYFIIVALSADVAASDNIYLIDIKRQPLLTALNELSDVAGFIWGTTFDEAKYLKERIVGPLKGYYTTRQAVDDLFKGTNLHYRWLDSGLLITAEEENKSSPQETALSIEEIVVVGSHIRGSNSAAPVFQYDREDIQSSSLATTQEFINSLPQIFGGGATEGAISPIKGEGARFNIANANGINLHGLGFDSTLVLLNGRRMAPVGFGDIVDVSGIPLNAIERIEVMTDGASAIYGSDAVGGVVNIILRKQYKGNETQASYGDVTAGSSESYKLRHTFGKHWQSGNALISYNFQRRARLSTEDRSFTQSATDPSDILGENTQHDVMLSLSQQVKEHADIYVDALYSTRKTKQNEAIFGGKNSTTSNAVKQFTLTGGGGIDFSNSWKINANALYGSSSTVSETIIDSGDNSTTGLDTWMLDAKVDGEVFHTLGGAAKLALGAQYRREVFALERDTATFSGKDKSARNIASAFAELFIPLISENNGMPGLERLEFTLAGRHEEYSDFGSSTNPKAGLLWSPVIGLNLRATYSTSFRAPLLFELNELAVDQTSSTALRFPNTEALNGGTPTLLIRGYNPELQPENSVNWTFGADIKPVPWPDFSLSFTYFQFDYADRIQTALEGADLPSVIADSSFASVVQHNPDIDLINFWVSQTNFIQLDGVALDEIEVLIDNRLRNIASVRERGIDFSLDYSLNTDVGQLSFRLGGTYLLTLESQAAKSAPFVDILNTPYNPVDLKLRNSIRWKRNLLTATAFINHIGNYKDKRSGQEKGIDSWTTFDLDIRYNIKESESSWWHGATVSFKVNNLFDKEPPFVSNALGYNFDAANASALGRRFYLEVSKKW